MIRSSPELADSLVPGERRLLWHYWCPGCWQVHEWHQRWWRRFTLTPSWCRWTASTWRSASSSGWGVRSAKERPTRSISAGFVALMRRLGAAAESVVYAPEFRREIEEPIAGAIPVPREVPLSRRRGQLPAPR